MGFNVSTVVFAAIAAMLITLSTPAVILHPSSPDQLPPQPALSYCSQQTWPNLDNSCLRYADSRLSRQDIRLIGSEQR